MPSSSVQIIHSEDTATPSYRKPLPANEHQWHETIQQHVTAQQQPAPYLWAGRAIKAANLVSTQAAGKLSYNIWFTPQNRPISDADKAFLKQAEQTTINYKHLKVPVYYWGNGPTILTVHGWGGHSGQFRQLTATLVDKGFSVISFDAPGHGFAEGKTTNVEDISEIIQLLAKQHELLGIVSHSIGGLASHDAIASGINRGFHAVLNTPMSLRHIVQAFKHQLSLPSEVIDQLSLLLEKQFGANLWERFDLRNSSTQDGARFYSYDNQDHQVPQEVSLFFQTEQPQATHVPTQGLGHNKPVRSQKVIDQLVRFIESL